MTGSGTDIRIPRHIPPHPFPLHLLFKEREEGRKERAIPSAAGALLRSNGVKQLKVNNHRQTVFVLKIHGFVEGQWFLKCCTFLVVGQSVKSSRLCRKINMKTVSPNKKDLAMEIM